MKILVYHTYYGCDTGCCGHRIEFYPTDDDKCYQSFEFDHAEKGQDLKEYARELAENFIKRHHPHCLDTIDWSTLEVEAASWDDCHL